MLLTCELCGDKYDKSTRLNKPGKLVHCPSCFEEADEVVIYTGNMIYSHKGGASIQINADPKLTNYINDSTKLKNKGSNLGNNLKVSGHLKNKAEGRCLKVADAFNYKNREDK